MRLWRRKKRPHTMEEALAAIRDHYGFFGISVDDLTDEQLVAGIKRFTDSARLAGVPARVAAERIRAACDAINRASSPVPTNESETSE